MVELKLQLTLLKNIQNNFSVASVAELADASHSECGGGNLRAGSSPVRGTYKGKKKWM